MPPRHGALLSTPARCYCGDLQRNRGTLPRANSRVAGRHSSVVRLVMRYVPEFAAIAGTRPGVGSPGSASAWVTGTGGPPPPTMARHLWLWQGCASWRHTSLAQWHGCCGISRGNPKPGSLYLPWLFPPLSLWHSGDNML